MKQSFGRKKDQCELQERLEKLLPFCICLPLSGLLSIFSSFFLSVSYSDGVASGVRIGQDVFRQII